MSNEIKETPVLTGKDSERFINKINGGDGSTIHYYWKHPKWIRRIDGFIAYSLCAIWSLFAPEEVDSALYKELSDQFKRTPSEILGRRENDNT